MSRSIFITGVLAVLSLHGQGINNNEVFQTLSNLSGARVLDEGFGDRVVKGKPFSATEERHSLQVLGDGTRIENTETNRLYRDSEGRTRVEEMNGKITIYDPVGKLSVELDPAGKIARKHFRGFFYVNGNTTVTLGETMTSSPWGPFAFGGYAQGSPAAGQYAQAGPAALKGVMTETTENLSSQNVNGVTAQGVRTTMTIPKGQIGNNRDIKILTERWTSDDLQMLVKSINSDPRFGDTTYQLTKVVRSAPDPALFQIPADYTVTDQASPLPKAKLVEGRPLPAPPAPPNPPGK
jgi:hypothetical protein